MSQTKAQLIDAVDGSIVDADIVGLTSSKLSGALPALNGSALTNIDGGKILQVKSTTKTDTFSTTSTSFTDVTGLSIAITPSSSSNKILVIYTTKTAMEDVYIGHIRLMRGSTAIFIGDASGAKTRTSGHNRNISGGTAELFDFSGVHLDSPGDTSSHTYKLQVQSATAGREIAVNRTYGDANSGETSRTASSITVLEVSA
tara:strand:+ start:31 stop:633 length:603 start_codon:yes stop_codon:yes gene_type:complete